MYVAFSVYGMMVTYGFNLTGDYNVRKQVIITKTVVGWYNIKDTQHNLMLNIPPKVFEQCFPDVSKDVQVACLEMDLSKITEIKNKKKVGS